MKKFLKNIKNSWRKDSPSREIPKSSTTTVTTPIKNKGVDAAKSKFYSNLSRFPEAHVSGVKPTVIISNELQAQITYLHNEFGNIEWSGFLLYKVLEGDLSAPENMVISAVGIFPCDVGSAAYTEYDPGDFILSMDDAYDFLSNGYKLGHIHTHHSMSCFFSGTDMAELHSNAPNYADSYYLSLIVNKSNSYCAKIAKIVTLEEVKTLAHVDCTIKYEIKAKVLEQIAAIRPKVTSYSNNYYGGTGYRSYNPTSYTTPKKSSSVLDKEWEEYFDEDYWDSRESIQTSNSNKGIGRDSNWGKPKVNNGTKHWSETDDADVYNDPIYGAVTKDLDEAIADLDKFLNMDNLEIPNHLLNGSTLDETKERIFLYSFGYAINIQPSKIWYMWTTVEILTYIANYKSTNQYQDFLDRWEKVFEAIDESKLDNNAKKIDALFFIEDELAKHTRTHLSFCASTIIKRVTDVREKLVEDVFFQSL
jgi:hypothetical protein